MKKHNCRRSLKEIEQHELAVKIRKMTDSQLCAYIDKIYKNAECLKSIEVGSAFVCDFINGIHPGSGIGQATIGKLKTYAEEKGFLLGGEDNR